MNRKDIVLLLGMAGFIVMADNRVVSSQLVVGSGMPVTGLRG